MKLLRKTMLLVLRVTTYYYVRWIAERRGRITIRHGEVYKMYQ